MRGSAANTSGGRVATTNMMSRGSSSPEASSAFWISEAYPILMKYSVPSAKSRSHVRAGLGVGAEIAIKPSSFSRNGYLNQGTV
jgi:hypothetical protein